MNNKESTEKISHSLWNWMPWQYERDRNYIYTDMLYWGHHQFAHVLNLTGRHSLLSKNNLYMNTGGIRTTPTLLSAALCNPDVPGGKTLVLSDGSAFLENHSSSSGIHVLRKSETFTLAVRDILMRFGIWEWLKLDLSFDKRESKFT